MKTPSILEYLRSRGCEITQEGSRWVTHSPLKALSGGIDKSPSFVIFSDGKFKDFSTGQCGTVYDLQRLLGGSLSNLPEFIPSKSKPQAHWQGDIKSKYLDVTPEELDLIREYGRSRKIIEGFTPGVYYTTKYERRPSLMMIHQDEDGVICGAKFRSIHNHKGERRFVMRGRPGFYILTTFGTIESPPQLYLVESETSANSLWMMAKETNRNAVVISHGSVSNIPKRLPSLAEGLQGSLILDFDGDEQLYSSRVDKYSHLGLKPVKLRLPKGEDINSLYASGEVDLIEHLI